MAIIFCNENADVRSREVILAIYTRRKEGKSREWLWGYLEGVDDTEGQLDKNQYDILSDFIMEITT